ncbi:MAG: recombinase family protein [Gammaproteobacteria bacterium]|nr:recombinase family protein [Gammaproteobacteria bacterium]
MKVQAPNSRYIRVSTIEQNTERQLNIIPLDETFTDKCSGKDTNRPALKELIKFVRKDDTVHVHDISRMARKVLPCGLFCCCCFVHNSCAA